MVRNMVVQVRHENFEDKSFEKKDQNSRDMLSNNLTSQVLHMMEKCNHEPDKVRCS